MILIVAEKNSVGNAISAVVGAADSHKGYNEGGDYIVSWCAGHLVEMKYPDDYGGGWDKRWSFSQLPMIPDKWQFKVSPKTSFQYNILKNLMQRNDVTEIICATDADREGETIFRYVYNMVGCRKPVKRLWVSSLEETAIRGALQNMKPMSAYDNLYHAGYSRAKADWLVGMNGSRLFSCRYGSKLNIGRVQTPTLAMIVQRDAEVNGFVKQKYFTADLNCGELILSSARIDNENAADMLVSACNDSTAVVTSVKREVKTEKAPKLYDLTTLQREANKAFGYTAQQTLDYTQSLYEGKLVTYPRTDSQYLSDDMTQTAFEVTKLCDTRFGFGISHTPDISKCINNAKVTGHHAINYFGYVRENSVIMAVGDKDMEWFKQIAGTPDLMPTKSNRPYSPPEKNIFGTAEYRYIPQQEYLTADRDLVLKMAEIMAKRGMQFSGRVYPSGKGTLTVSHADLFAVRNIRDEVVNMRKQFASHDKAQEVGNRDYRANRDTHYYMSKLTPEQFSEVKPFLETGVGYHAVSRDGKVAFALDKENAPAFHRALENAVREVGLIHTMQELSLSKDKMTALAPVMHRLAVENMQIDLADFFDQRYDDAQFGEMLSLVNAYINRLTFP